MKCKSCNIDLVDHLGLQGTCAELQKALEHIRVLEKKLGYVPGKINQT